MNLKTICSQSEIWKEKIQSNTSHNKKKKWVRRTDKVGSLGKRDLCARARYQDRPPPCGPYRCDLIKHNVNLKSRGCFIAVAHISASIRATSSLAACRSDLTCLSLSTLIASFLAFCSALTLTASSGNHLSSYIMYISTFARNPASALTVSILSTLFVHGLYWVSNHRKI